MKEGLLLKQWIKDKGYSGEEASKLLKLKTRQGIYEVYKHEVLPNKYKELLKNHGFDVDNVKLLSNKENIKRGVPVYNVDYTASDVTQFDDEREKIIGYVDLNGFRKCKYIVRVAGPSMEPDFMSGDFIGLEPVDDFTIIEYGQPYAITTKSKQKFVKQIRRGKDNDNLILRSKNPEHDDIDLHKKQILKLFKVHGPIRDQWQ